jgi:zinc transport system substrate-binding protein
MYLQIFLFIFSVLPLLSYGAERVVLVSMAPYVELVGDLTSKQVQVELLVPAGFSAHTYEPTPKQIMNATKGTIWFTVGELFEARVQAALQSENPKLVVVDLRQGLSLMNGHEHEGHHHNCCGADTHIWMSPKMMQPQIELMAKSLSSVFPELATTIEKNKGPLLEKLAALDKTIHNILDNHKGQIIFVGHPAYGYFCREYGLVEESIEFEGKDPTPKHLYTLIEEAKAKKVQTIFIQKQYGTKAAELVAHEIGAKLVWLDPYSEHYFESMLQIAKSFSEAG